MSMSDPIADMLTRIRNAQSGRQGRGVDAVVEGEGGDRTGPEGRGLHRRLLGARPKTARAELEIALKYYAGRPVIERIERVSRPGLRVYTGRDAIPQVHERPGCGDRHHAQGRDDRPQGAPDRCRRRSAVLRRLIERRNGRIRAMSRVGKMPVDRPARRGRVDHGGADHASRAANGTLVRALERAGRGQEGRRHAELRAGQRQRRSRCHERHDARAGQQHGQRRHQGLREEADAGRRGLPRPGAGRRS